MENHNWLVTDDIVFQKIFGKVGNERITKDFLEKLLGIKIDGLSLDTNKRMQGEWLENKTGRLDVKAKLNDGTKVLIEMQVATYDHMIERVLYYWSMVYTENLNKGEKYNTLDKTISILISVENLKQTKGIERYHTKWHLREDIAKDRILTNDMEIHIIELEKFDNRKEEGPVDDWIKFIKAKGVDEMSVLIEKDDVLAEAIEEFNKLQGDPEMRDYYIWKKNSLLDKILSLADAEEKGRAKGEAEGRAIGEAKGITKGKKEKQKEIVLNMHRKNFDIETICDITNLSKDEVKEIINQGK